MTTTPRPPARLPGYAYARRLADQARDLPPLVVDAVLALGCYLAVVVYLVYLVANDRQQWWLFVLAAGQAVPLLWRRRYPLTVTTVTGICTTWLALVGALGQFPAGQLVATYTFAHLCPPVRRVIGVLGTAIGVTVSIVVPGDELLGLGPATIMFVVAYALGTSVRARRDRIAMLEERARRLAEEQAAAATWERERIAREVHDILAHSMSLVVVQAEAGPVAARTHPGRVEEVFDTISATGREALAQLRRVLGVLRSGEPELRPQPGLADLPSLVASARAAGLAATLEEHGSRPPVPPDLATTAYRIVQESLTNTVTHARAGEVRVRLAWQDDALELEVRDDGDGPSGEHRRPGGPGRAGTGPGPDGSGPDGPRPDGPRPPGGHGLIGMRERIAALGGELATGPGPDGVGYRVAARLPVAGPGEPGEPPGESGPL